jgi:hypothetical protein
MEPECSKPHSQEHTAWPRPEPHESSPLAHSKSTTEWLFHAATNRRIFQKYKAYTAISRITCLQGSCLVQYSTFKLYSFEERPSFMWHFALRIPLNSTSLRMSVWTTRFSCCCFRIASRSVLSTITETNFWHVPANIILCSTLWPFSCPVRPSPSLSPVSLQPFVL